MLDYSYKSLKLFAIACVIFGYDARALIANGTFVYCADGWIVAKDFVTPRT